MRIPLTRLSGSIAYATLVTLFVLHDAVNATTIPGFLVATLVAYLAWPAFGARLPAGYAPTLTRWGLVTALLLNLALAVSESLLRGEPIVAPTVAMRFVTLLLGTFAIAVVVFTLHGVRRPSNGASR
jgi:hypothetical protein